MEREHLGSRLGFILLSAGCAIGVGNVWKFPWLCGQNGGGAFVLVYLIFLVILGVPIMTIEFAMGRASQASPAKMYQQLEPAGTKWHVHGIVALIGNIIFMMCYSSITGWIFYYFVRFLSGDMVGLSVDQVSETFYGMLANPGIMVGYVAIVVVLCFLVLSFSLQGGLERVTKYLMVVLFALMIVLAVRAFFMSGAKEGLAFYLIPDFSKITSEVVVAAMNQSFFTLSLGIGSMAIFGSYIGKDRSLMGESVNIIILDTFVAIMAGLIIFPACFTYDVEPGAGPSLLFIAMANVFSNMKGGSAWGALFFLFMAFAAFSTVLAVSENILACVKELTGWSRRKSSIISGIGVLVLSLPCALGWNVWSNVHFFGMDSLNIMDWEDFTVNSCLLPIGCFVFVLFCTMKKHAWGWDAFKNEANTGTGLKVRDWMRPYITYVLPIIILVFFVIGLVNFFG